MPKKCKVCKTDYEPRNSMQNWCSPNCGFELSQKKLLQVVKKKEKEKRKRYRADKERIKTRGEHLREAQTAFNKFIRLRDRLEPCISCQRHHTGQYHAGHYKTVGAHPELRFNELNVRRQCQPCNNHLSGNLTNYRINLINKIGLDKVEFLEGPHPITKYTIEEIKAIKAKYRAKCREIEKELA